MSSARDRPRIKTKSIGNFIAKKTYKVLDKKHSNI